MSKSTKLRGTDCPLTRLKELWLKPQFAFSRDYWREQFAPARTQEALRQEILQKYNIHLRHDSQLTVFRQWVRDQDFREKAEKAARDRRFRRVERLLRTCSNPA